MATDINLCSQIGVDVLQDGGNAIDAAIASTLCIGITMPYNTGIGGGSLITCALSQVDIVESISIKIHTFLMRDQQLPQI